MTNLTPEALRLLHVHAAGGWELVAKHEREAVAVARAEAATRKTVVSIGPPEPSERSHPLFDANNPATSWALNPWMPMSRPIDLKHLGKLAEELNEAGSAVARCIIQGIEQCEPITHKPNREWLEDELADVGANIDLVAAHFGLDLVRMHDRSERKKIHLRGWHSMLDDVDGPPPSLRAAAAETLRYMDKIVFGDGSTGRARVQKLLRDALGEGG